MLELSKEGLSDFVNQFKAHKGIPYEVPPIPRYLTEDYRTFVSTLGKEGVRRALSTLQNPSKLEKLNLLINAIHKKEFNAEIFNSKQFTSL
jgi:hypothetical protein